MSRREGPRVKMFRWRRRRRPATSWAAAGGGTITPRPRLRRGEVGVCCSHNNSARSVSVSFLTIGAVVALPVGVAVAHVVGRARPVAGAGVGALGGDAGDAHEQ